MLQQPLAERIEAVRARKPKRLPVVLTNQEVQRLFPDVGHTAVDGAAALWQWLAAHTCTALTHSASAGVECVRLRVKDINFERLEITVRDTKGQTERPP